MVASSPVARTKVFISYSHRDIEFLQRLQVHLAFEVRSGRVDLWDDTRIAPGAQWQAEIDRALQAARVAVLLVSADFLASESIMLNELQPLLSVAESEEITLLPVLLKSCLYKNTPLAQLQFVNSSLMPVISMSEAQQEEFWTRVAESITQALGPSVLPTSLSADASGRPQQAVQEMIDERYHKALLADSSITKLQVLTMSSPLPISSIYVRLQVHEETQQKALASSKQEETHDPLTLVQQRERLLESRFRMAMDPADALRKYSQCIIVGDPGAGKTTLLKYLTNQSTNKELNALPDVPVYVRLHAFASSGESDLLAFVAHTWEKDYGMSRADAQSYIAKQVAADNVLFLLDALDETAIGDTVEKAEASYKRVSDEITRLSRRCSWIAVTARKAGYHQRAKLHAFTELEILDFRLQEIEQFIDNWFLNHPREERRGYAPDLKREIKNSLRIQTLAANPLLLALITLVFEEEMTLPERRSALYKKCVDTLLVRWDASRSIRRARGFRLEYQKQLLQEIAWQMHTQGVRYITAENVIAIIALFLPRLGMDASLAQDVLLEISGDMGLLREQADEIYGFFHLTLQEYFASQQVKDSSVLLEHLNDPWWEEVILLYAGEVPDATPLLEHLLVAEGPGEMPEDIFASKLTLAGRCLATHPTIQNISLWETIPDLLFKQLLQTDYALTRQHVAETLVEIGRSYSEQDVNRRLLELLTSTKSKAKVRVTIAAALGAHGTREGTSDLVEFLVQTGEVLEAELRDTIGGTIAKLADRSLLPRLLELVSDKNTDPLVAIAVAYCIGKVGDASTATLLFPLLTYRTTDAYVRAALAFSAGLLGDATIISALTKLIADPTCKENLATSVLVALSYRDYRPALPELLHLLAQKQLSSEIRMQVASTLGNIGDHTVLNDLASCVADSALEIEVREACATALTACAIRTRQSTALTMLADEFIDKDIRTHMAYVVALLGDKKLLAEVRSIQLQERDEQVRMALIIALGLLGDSTVLGELQASLLGDSIPDYLYRRAADIIVQHIPAPKLIEMLTNAKMNARIRVVLAQALGATDKSALVPDLLKLLANPVVAEEVRMSVAEAIGMLGENKASVEKLCDLWQRYALRDPLHLSVLVDTIYQALWVVSRRAGVVVVRVGTEYKVLDKQHSQ